MFINSLIKGKYWEWIRHDPELYSSIRFMHIEAPTEIFGL